MFRLLGLLGGLSVAMDLGVGAPVEESLRRCLVTARLARAVGCPEPEVTWAMYTSLLQHLGCTAASHELAGVFGDDIAATRHAFLMESQDLPGLVRGFVPGVAAASGRSRVHVLASALLAGNRIDATAPRATCEVARDAAKRLGLPEQVRDALFHTTATWDGRGFPPVGGEDIPRPARLMHVASVAVLFALLAGDGAAENQVRRRAGGELDPQIAEHCTPDLLEGLHDGDPFTEVLDAEPDPVVLVDAETVEAVAATFADLADLKSPWFHGHSQGVAALSAAAGERMGLDARDLRIAGLLHDVGRLAVPSGIWDKQGRLSAAERAQVELHPYHSEQVLARVPDLARLAPIVGRHHERLDGSGYHRGLSAPQLTAPERILAAADRYHTLLEGRPHRAARPPEEAARVVLDDVRAGHLDADAVAGVLESAGHRAPGRRRHASQLTDRQVDVLRLVAAGLSNPEIARRLVISRRTAEHHVQDVYARIGVSSRAGAALFAMEHGLAGPTGR